MAGATKDYDIPVIVGDVDASPVSLDMVPIFRYCEETSQHVFVGVMDPEEAKMRFPLGKK